MLKNEGLGSFGAARVLAILFLGVLAAGCSDGGASVADSGVPDTARDAPADGVAKSDLAVPDLTKADLLVPDSPVTLDLARADTAAADAPASFDLALSDADTSDLAKTDSPRPDAPTTIDAGKTPDGPGDLTRIDGLVAVDPLDAPPGADAAYVAVVDASQDMGDPAAGYRVLSMALAAGPSGTTMAYEIHCTACSVPWPRTRVLVFEPGVEKKEAANPLYQGQATQGTNPLYNSREPRRGAVVAGAVAPQGTHHAYLLDPGDAPLAAVAAPFVPGGAIISAKAASLAIGRQTPNTSFGTMVRSGQFVATASGAYLAVGLDTTLSSSPIALASVSSDLVVSRPGAAVAPDADQAIVATSERGNAIAFRTRAPSDGGANDGDGPVRVQVRQGTEALLAPVEGAPAALWTDGVGFRVAVKTKDSIAAIWDGKTSFFTPRSDEAACASLIFDENGRALFLHAGPKSAVLYVQNGAGFDPPMLLSRRDVAGPETDACALAATGATIHAAWTEDHAFIAYAALDAKTLQTVLRTKHDTAKNSVGNIR